MKKIFVRPAAGLLQRMPDSPHEFLPEGGAEVEPNAFWHRRIADGDVVEGKAKSAAPAKQQSISKE